MEVTKEPFCCRICAKQVEIEVLRDHSMVCKEYHLLLDSYKTCNEELQRRIDDSYTLHNQLRSKLALKLNDKTSEPITSLDLKKINELTKQWKALELITQYGEKISRNQLEFDPKLEEQLKNDLQVMNAEIEDQNVYPFVKKIIKLLEDKISFKRKINKKDIELQMTLTPAGGQQTANIDPVRQFILRNSHTSPKLPRPTPLLGGSPIFVRREVRRDEKRPSPGQEEKREPMKQLPSINEVDSNSSTPKVTRRQLDTKAQVKPSAFGPKARNPPEEKKDGSPSVVVRVRPGVRDSPGSQKRILEHGQQVDIVNMFDKKMRENVNAKINSNFGYNMAGLGNLMPGAAFRHQHELFPKPSGERIVRPMELHDRERGRKNNIIQGDGAKITLEENSKQTQKRHKRNSSLELFKNFEKIETGTRFPSLSREPSLAKDDETEVLPKKNKSTKKAETMKDVLKAADDDEKGQSPLDALVRSDRKNQSEKITSTSRSPKTELHVHHLKQKIVMESLEAGKLVELPILRGYFSDPHKRTSCQRPITAMSIGNKHETIDDFEFIKMISKGGFGKVWLVRHKKHQEIFAMKIIDCAEKMGRNRIANLKSESDVLHRLEGDFVVKALYTFTHENYICFVMEYMAGGDFTAMLDRYQFLDEQIARFYIAELILAINSLHEIGIVHRDLKPDNILLDSQGHIKLADFGLSQVGLDTKAKICTPDMKRNCLFSATTFASKLKEMKFNRLCDPSKNINLNVRYVFTKNNGDNSTSPLQVSQRTSKIRTSLAVSSRSSSTENNENSKESRIGSHKKSSESTDSDKRKIRIVGTPDYIAPEVITGEYKIGPAIDWWSCGVLLFEFLVSVPPFYDDKERLVFNRIVNMEIEWPLTESGEEFLSPEAKDLIQRFLTKDPEKRLGVNGIEEIKSHPFFAGFDWDNVRVSTAPLKPMVDSDTDTRNFDNKKNLTEEEKKNPFGVSKGINEEAKSQKPSLNRADFEMKRIDFLHELNLKYLREMQEGNKKNSEE